MVITTREDVTKQGSCKLLSQKLCLRGSLLLEIIQVLGGGGGAGRGAEGGRLFEFECGGEEVGWRWALINFFCLLDGRLFEVGANSRLGAFSNKYGILSKVGELRWS